MPRPAGTTAGDVLVAQFVINDDDTAITPPPGWTLVRTDGIGDTLRQAICTKAAGTSEPASYPFAFNQWRRIAAGISAYRGVDLAQPVDAHAAAVDASADTAATAASITTSVPGTRLLHLVALNAEGSVTPPAGMTERYEAASPNLASARDALAQQSDVHQPDAGPTGAHTATATMPGPHIATHLALRPAG